MLDNRALIGISRPRLLWCLADRVIFCGLIRQMAQLAPGLAPLADSPIEHCFPRWVRDGGPCLPCDSLARQKTNTGKMPTMIGWDLEGSFLAAMAGRNGSKLWRSESRKPALNRLPVRIRAWRRGYRHVWRRVPLNCDAIESGLTEAVMQAPRALQRWMLAPPGDPPPWRYQSFDHPRPSLRATVPRCLECVRCDSPLLVYFVSACAGGAGVIFQVNSRFFKTPSSRTAINE